MTTLEILKQQLSIVWGEYPGIGYIASYDRADEQLRPEAYVNWPSQNLEKVLTIVNGIVDKGRDVFYCPAFIKAKGSHARDNILGSSTLWYEVDGAVLPKIEEFKLKPALIIESSPGKHHVYFKLDQFIDRTEAVAYYNRILTHMYDGDANGWQVNKLLRIAGTKNFKYDSTPDVKIVYRSSDVNKWVEPDLPEEETYESIRPKLEGDAPEAVANLIAELMEKATRASVAHDKAECFVDGQKFDRSEAYYHLGLTMYEAGFNEEQVANHLKAMDMLFKKWDSNVRARDSKREAKRLFKIYGEKEADRIETASLTFAGLQGDEPSTVKTEDEKFKETAALYFKRGSEMGPAKKLRWLLDELIPLGKFTLLAGRPKLGKTTLATQWAADITRGTAQGEFRNQPKDVLIIAMEEFWDDWYPRLIAAGADIDRIRFWTWPNKPTFPRDIKVIKALLDNMIEDGVEPAMMIVDPIQSRFDDKLDSYKDSDIRKALESVAELSNAYKMTTLGIIHWNGSNSPTLALNIMGSKGIAGVSRATLHVVESPDSSDEQKISLYGMDEGSFSHNTKCGAFTFEPVDVEVSDGSTRTSKLKFLEDAEGSIGTNWRRTLAKLSKEASGRGTAPRKNLQREVAKSYIMSLLEQERGRAGVTPTLLQQYVKLDEAGISRATLFRALEELVDEQRIYKEAQTGVGNPVLYKKSVGFLAGFGLD